MTVPNKSNTAKPGDMYRLKPIYKLDEKIELPTNMYKLPNLHSSSSRSVTTNADDISGMPPEMKALHQRQASILSTLENLKNEMQSISNKLGHKFGDKTPHSEKLSDSPTDEVLKLTVGQKPVAPISLPDGVLDYVISISPQNLSLSPLFLAMFMQSRGMDVGVVTHLHSSLTEDLQKELLHGFSGLKGRVQVKTSKIYFTFVFKTDSFCPSLLLSPTNQTRIIGEVNIARYLARMFLPDLYEQSEGDIASIDQWLENAQKMVYGNRKEKESAMKAINGSLGKQRHIACKEATIADVVSLAAMISQKNYFKTLPNNVKKWFLDAPPSFQELSKKFGIPESWYN